MFENNTAYDKPAIQAMTWVFSRKVRRKQYLLRKCFLLGGGSVSLLGGLLLLSVFGALDDGERVICVVGLVIGVPALLKGIFLRRFQAWSSLRALRQTTGTSELRRFVFSEDSFQSTQAGMETTWQYEKVREAYETEGYFVLRLDKLTCILLDKAGFTRGTAWGFRAFLERRLGKPVEWSGRRKKNGED